MPPGTGPGTVVLATGTGSGSRIAGPHSRVGIVSGAAGESKDWLGAPAPFVLRKVGE